jgi:hypothetical protein
MARPRKNRIGEYARLLGQELERLLGRAVSDTVAETQRGYQLEVAALRAEIRQLGRRLDSIARRPVKRRAALGRWVPGGPGRPPKDAADRVAAFAEKSAVVKRSAPKEKGRQRPRPPKPTG